jgi:hypothetical protein
MELVTNGLFLQHESWDVTSLKREMKDEITSEEHEVYLSR